MGNDLNRNFYLVTGQYNGKGFTREMPFELMTLNHVVNDIVDGQYDEIDNVIMFNPHEHHCGEVNKMIAEKCMQLILKKGVDGETSLPNFVADHVPDHQERLEEALIEAMGERKHQRRLNNYYHSAAR